MEFSEEERRIMRFAILGAMALVILVLALAVASILFAGCTSTERAQATTALSQETQGTQDMTITLSGNVDMATGDVDLVADLTGKSATTMAGRSELQRRTDRRSSPDTSGIGGILALVLGGGGGIGLMALVKRLLNQLINSEGGKLLGPAVDPKAHQLAKMLSETKPHGGGETTNGGTATAAD